MLANRIFSILSICYLLLVPISALASVVDGEFLPPPWSEVFDKGTIANPLKFKFIFVSFPNTVEGQDIIGPDVTDVLDNYVALLQEQSNENLVVDYSVLFDPRDSTNQQMWVASEESGVYGDVLTTPPDTLNCWLDPLDYNYSYLGALEGEIFKSIQAAYDSTYGVGGWTSPLAGDDMVIFITKPATPSGNPLGTGGEGGVDEIHVLASCSVLQDVLSGAPTIGLNNDERVYGFIVNWWNLAEKNAISLELVHELGHKLGLGHPTESEDGQWPERWCHFGSYNVMRAIAPPGIRYGLIDHWSRYRLGWCNVTEITRDTLALDLLDWRDNGDVVKIVVAADSLETQSDDFPEINSTSYYEEYFLLAYQTGSYPYYEAADSGLYVWHVLDRRVRFWQSGEISARSSMIRDLEIATGLFRADNLSVPDRVDGVDLLDNWIGRTGYDLYLGADTDLYNYSEANEFSYRTNPSASGYEWTTALTQANKFDVSQNQLNSLSVKVGYGANGASLDIEFAPSEDVTFPNGGEVLIAGSDYSITWSKEFTVDAEDGIISSVDIYVDLGSGGEEQLLVASAPADSGSYQWTPGPEHLSAAAKIRIDYHNINDATHTGTDESDDYFVVVAPPVAKFTDVSAGTSLNYSGQPTCAIGYDSNTDDKKDLFVGIEPGGPQSHAYQQTVVGQEGEPQFSNIFLFTPQAGARAVVNGDYDNDGDMDLVVTAVGGAKVYRKDGQDYTEVSSTLGLASLTDKSTAAVWGDYDDDGWLDLYVVRSGGYTDPPTFPNVFGEQHRLFRNEIAFGNGFVDVTSAAGLSGAAIGSVSASFIDFDKDGDLDLFVANIQEPPTGPGGIHSLLYVNQGNGTFTEEYESRFSGDVYYATAHKWSDVDNDGDFDLVMTTHEYKPEIHFNDGFGGFTIDPVKRLDAAEGHAGLEVFDQDLDGWYDIFCVANDGVNTNRFYSGVETVAGVEYIETSASVGMDGVSVALGSAAVDFTRDGDPDLFLGKALGAGGYFYITESQGGDQWIGRDYVKVRLESLYAANNRAGLGAIVEVTDGTRTWIRSVDGGSGRGGQDDRDLVFGLGENAGTVTATVRWPNGQVQSGISLTKSNEALGETLNLIADDSPVFVNVSATSVINPVTGTLDWTFYWESHLPGDSSQDVVSFDQVGCPTPCWPGWPNLTPSTPGVVPDYDQLPNGKYFHKLVVSNVDCIRGCGFRFTVSSDVSGTLFTSATKSVTVKFCPAQF